MAGCTYIGTFQGKEVRGHTHFIVQSIRDVETLEGEHKPHTPRDVFPATTSHSLGTDHANVDENP